jgi:hypothetical protein
MTSDAPKAPVVPNPALPKTIGILNLVFGSLLMLCGVCSGLYTIAMAAAQGQMTMLQGKQGGLNVQVKVEHEGKPGNTPAKTKEKVATTPAEEEEKAATKPAGEPKKKPGEPADEPNAAPVPKPPPPRVSMVEAMNDPANGFAGLGSIMNRYLLVDLSTGMVLNILMMIAGVGLVLLREWGRKLAIMVAGLKIVRLVILCAVCLTYVIPDFTTSMNKFFDKMSEFEAQAAAQQAPSGAPAAPGAPAPPGAPGAPGARAVFSDPQMKMMMTRSYVVMFAGTSVFISLVGLIYPCVTLAVLTRPKARAACESKRMEF